MKEVETYLGEEREEKQNPKGFFYFLNKLLLW